MKGAIMTLKEFGENAEIEYTCYVTVNGETAGEISAFSQESLQERFSKLDHAINKEIEKQYEDLPEPIEDEAPEEDR